MLRPHLATTRSLASFSAGMALALALACGPDPGGDAGDASSGGEGTGESGDGDGNGDGDGDGCPGAAGCECEADPDCLDGTWCHEGTCKAPSCGDDIVDPEEECDDDDFFEGCGCTDACVFECVPKECSYGAHTPCSEVSGASCGEAECDGYTWDLSACHEPEPIPDAGLPGPELPGCAVQCAGFLDEADQDDLPDGWASNCIASEPAAIALVCGTPDVWRGVVISADAFDAQGPTTLESAIIDSVFSEDPPFWPDTLDVELLGTALDQGATTVGGSGDCDGQAHGSIGIETPGCAFEVANCFGLGFDEAGHDNENAPRYLWAYAVE